MDTLYIFFYYIWPTTYMKIVPQLKLKKINVSQLIIAHTVLKDHLTINNYEINICLNHSKSISYKKNYYKIKVNNLEQLLPLFDQLQNNFVNKTLMWKYDRESAH